MSFAGKKLMQWEIVVLNKNRMEMKIEWRLFDEPVRTV
jgi:hypothetical protein